MYQWYLGIHRMYIYQICKWPEAKMDSKYFRWQEQSLKAFWQASFNRMKFNRDKCKVLPWKQKPNFSAWQESVEDSQTWSSECAAMHRNEMLLTRGTEGKMWGSVPRYRSDPIWSLCIILSFTFIQRDMDKLKYCYRMSEVLKCILLNPYFSMLTENLKLYIHFN